eukprot:GHVN01031728.1.p1 GENE.GHVN01031728.1~~GHVN01031728.1.p1  ORF type:complete len:400 (+),score=78.75 GHVN01031728.1:172-1371(+)
MANAITFIKKACSFVTFAMCPLFLSLVSLEPRLTAAVEGEALGLVFDNINFYSFGKFPVLTTPFLVDLKSTLANEFNVSNTQLQMEQIRHTQEEASSLVDQNITVVLFNVQSSSLTFDELKEKWSEVIPGLPPLSLGALTLNVDTKAEIAFEIFPSVALPDPTVVELSEDDFKSAAVSQATEALMLTLTEVDLESVKADVGKVSELMKATRSAAVAALSEVSGSSDDKDYLINGMEQGSLEMLFSFFNKTNPLGGLSDIMKTGWASALTDKKDLLASFFPGTSIDFTADSTKDINTAPSPSPTGPATSPSSTPSPTTSSPSSSPSIGTTSPNSSTTTLAPVAGKSGLATGAIVGIVLAVCVGIALLAVTAFMCMKRRQAKLKDVSETVSEQPITPGGRI